jgi:carboxypeptidase T
MFLVKIIAKSLEELLSLERFPLDLKENSAEEEKQGRFVITGILTQEQINHVSDSHYTVEIITDLSNVPKQRLREVSTINRFDSESKLSDLEQAFADPSLTGYMNVQEIESALINLSALHPDLVTLIKLPYKSWEGRQSNAVRLRAGVSNPNRVGVLFTGSTHAREWGGSDICINFLGNIINANTKNSTITYGAKTFSAEQIKTILENIDLFVFPDVNPDGKNYSQTVDVGTSLEDFWWRKNRNPNGSIENFDKGVDVNRNYDFLWSSNIGTSRDQSSPNYKGNEAFSEPESKNVRHLFDTYENIHYFVDVHSHGGLILYNWGDDDNQNTDTDQNFRNPAYDGKRGIPRDTLYREFIQSDDASTEMSLANGMNDSLSAVNGRRYKVQQGVKLYPTSATSRDYAFGRHLVDDKKSKIYSFTIEFGNEFVPPYSEMKNVIKEVSAAMTELCFAAASSRIVS